MQPISANIEHVNRIRSKYTDAGICFRLKPSPLNPPVIIASLLGWCIGSFLASLGKKPLWKKKDRGAILISEYSLYIRFQISFLDSGLKIKAREGLVTSAAILRGILGAFVTSRRNSSPLLFFWREGAGGGWVNIHPAAPRARGSDFKEDSRLSPPLPPPPGWPRLAPFGHVSPIPSRPIPRCGYSFLFFFFSFPSGTRVINFMIYSYRSHSRGERPEIYTRTGSGTGHYTANHVWITAVCMPVTCSHRPNGPDADSPSAWTLYLADNRRDILRLLAGIISHMPNPPGPSRFVPAFR